LEKYLRGEILVLLNLWRKCTN